MYFTAKDAQYWYELDGEGDPVLLLHGFTSSSATWTSFIQNGATLQFITLDLPGHGKTVVNVPKTMETCCTDLIGLLNFLQISKVHLIGYSMGGRTALSFAMLYPERLHSLTLESTSPGLEQEDGQQKRITNDEKIAQKIEHEGIKSFVDFWEDLPLFQTQKMLPSHVQRKIRDERLSQSADGLSQSLRFMGTGKQPSWWGALSDLKMPVLLLAGAFDSKFIEINKAMACHIPSSELVIAENAGHAIHVEQPAFFGRIVSGFLHSIR